MFNYWRTASTELVALAPKAPWIGRKGAFNGDRARWNTANVISHPYLEYDGNEMPVRQPFAGPPAGALQEALNASDDIKATMGIYDAALGARSNETSGRAIMQRQRESDVATFNYVDNLSRAIRHAGRILVDLIPKVYSAPRIIRVIHEDGSNESVPINQPFVPQQQKDPRAQQYDANKLAQQVDGLTKIYDVTTGKYDVTCEAGPSYTTKREEAASGMLEMGKMFPPMMQVAGDLLVKNLDWPALTTSPTASRCCCLRSCRGRPKAAADATPDAGNGPAVPAGIWRDAQADPDAGNRELGHQGRQAHRCSKDRC